MQRPGSCCASSTCSSCFTAWAWAATASSSTCSPTNWIRFDRPLFSTNAGSLAYGANCHAAYYSRLIGTWPCFPPLHATPKRNEADVSAELRRRGLDFASDHAGRVPAVMGVRLLPLAIAGGLLLRRRHEPLRLLLAPVVLVALVAIGGYGTPRFRVPAEITIVVLAAVALVAMAGRRREAT